MSTDESDMAAGGTQAEADAYADRVETVAQAIYGEGAYCGDCPYSGWDDCPECRRYARGYARAAIAALPPSPAEEAVKRVEGVRRRLMACHGMTLDRPGESRAYREAADWIRAALSSPAPQGEVDWSEHVGSCRIFYAERTCTCRPSPAEEAVNVEGDWIYPSRELHARDLTKSWADAAQNAGCPASFVARMRSFVEVHDRLYRAALASPAPAPQGEEGQR